MESRRRRIDRGFLIDEDHAPPSLKQIGGIRYTLRALALACREQGLPCRLDIAGIVAWLDAAERRGCRPSGLSVQVRQLLTFAVWCDPKSDLRKPLRRLARRKAELARMQRKRKEQWLIDNDISLADVWEKAEALLAESADLPLASRARHKAVIEAVAVALAVVVPLRIGDLHRLVVGRDIERTAVGWRLALQTEKTGLEYHRPELWPELTPFLDALMAADAPGGDFWAGYDLRIGKPLFSFDGETCVHRDWVSDVWQDHIGTGAHIVRTLWHEIVGESDDDRLWVALALCGQKDRRTAREYRIRQTQKAASAKGADCWQRDVAGPVTPIFRNGQKKCWKEFRIFSGTPASSRPPRQHGPRRSEKWHDRRARPTKPSGEQPSLQDELRVLIDQQGELAQRIMLLARRAGAEIEELKAEMKACAAELGEARAELAELRAAHEIEMTEARRSPRRALPSSRRRSRRSGRRATTTSTRRMTGATVMNAPAEPDTAPTASAKGSARREPGTDRDRPRGRRHAGSPRRGAGPEADARGAGPPRARRGGYCRQAPRSRSTPTVARSRRPSGAERGSAGLTARHRDAPGIREVRQHVSRAPPSHGTDTRSNAVRARRRVAPPRPCADRDRREPASTLGWPRRRRRRRRARLCVHRYGRRRRRSGRMAGDGGRRSAPRRGRAGSSGRAAADRTQGDRGSDRILRPTRTTKTSSGAQPPERQRSGCPERLEPPIGRHSPGAATMPFSQPTNVDHLPREQVQAFLDDLAALRPGTGSSSTAAAWRRAVTTPVAIFWRPAAISMPIRSGIARSRWSARTFQRHSRSAGRAR